MMTPERWATVERICQAALELDAAKRGRFVAEACAGDEALRRDVESLLEHDGGAAFLSTPAAVHPGEVMPAASSLIGQALGPYVISTRLGAGGMGEVYRARDQKLGRDVAIKILPTIFASDPERLTRFAREARVLAALNHPHIGAIYGLEALEATPALVLELVEGETLAQRIAKGPCPIADALRVAAQIAEALEAAHEKGIIHRDLKPANIKITPEGVVKVLDFGLAKSWAGAAGEAGRAGGKDLTHSPTITLTATRDGVLLGTAAYMSPEQARGQAVDKRTDIWAFGCVLYEMLTGRAAFAGETVTDTLAAIVERDADWSALPPDTPASFVRLLRRCLDKDLKWRLHDMADVRIEFREAIRAPASDDARGMATSNAGRRRWTVSWLGAAVAMSLASAGIVWSVMKHDGGRLPSEHLSIALPASAPILVRGSFELSSGPVLALSPDGTRLAYVGPADSDGTPRLYLRALDVFEPHSLDGTKGASAPFFSPDGQWVGFFAAGKLKRVSVRSGVVATICDAPEDTGGSGGAWGPDDTIVFAVRRSSRLGLFRVSAYGGAPEVLTRPDPTEEGGHGDPAFIAGARAVLFTTRQTRAGVPSSVMVHSLTTGQSHKLVDGDSRPMYTTSGHLIYNKAGAVWAAPFRVDTLQATGPSVQVVEDVFLGWNFDVSAAGRFAYIAAQPLGGHLLWVDRDGSTEPLLDDAQARFGRPRLSPDGQRLVVEVERDAGRTDIGVYRFDNRTLTLLTTDGVNDSPNWHPSGRRVVFRARGNLLWQPADGTAPPEVLLNAAEPTLNANKLATGVFLPDGSMFTFVVHGSTATGADIWALRLEPRRLVPLVQRQGNQWGVRVSPDGGWISYASNESGRFEIYIEPSSGGGTKLQVSHDGGTEGVWSPAGDELFYRTVDRMMVVPIRKNRDSPLGAPQVLFNGHYVSTDNPHYDVTRDGKRFLMVKPIQDDADARTIRLIENWFDELKARVPTK